MDGDDPWGPMGTPWGPMGTPWEPWEPMGTHEDPWESMGIDDWMLVKRFEQLDVLHWS